MKVRVHDSDGIYRGGLFKTDVFNALNCRMWHARPQPDCEEYLIDISGHGEPSHANSWYTVQLSDTPDISGPSDGSDNFDAKSLAIRVTPLEASHWFENQVYDPPPDLVRLARIYSKIGPDPGEGQTVDEEPSPALPPSLKEVWDLLENHAFTGKELAQRVKRRLATEGAMRKRISAIRLTDRTIDNKRGFGFCRPDAPPDDLRVGERESC